MSDDPFDYAAMVRDALRTVAQRALRVAAENGLTGDHHFYVSFRSTAEGVVLPATLRRQYPEEMTIVLQHQYWNLEAGEDAFSVDLRFAGTLSRLVVPYGALTAFADPSAEFGLRFDEPAQPEPAAPPPEAAPPATPSDGEANVVDIRSFRKRPS